MADLEKFKNEEAAQTVEESKEGRSDPLQNVKLIEEIMQDQTKYSAYVETVLEEELKEVRDEINSAA